MMISSSIIRALFFLTVLTVHSKTSLILANMLGDDDLPAHILTQFEPEIGYLEGIELVEDSLLLSKQSEYQMIEVHKSRFYGNILLLDNVLQITERDGDSYNEMMAHIPMFLHPKPKRVLIIGGGDGYVLSEVLKHESVEVVDHVDLDGEVIEVCKEFFGWGKAWNDPRVNLHITDGAQFVQDKPDGYYDVIIQDSSDPWIVDDEGNMTPLPSGVLFEQKHFEDLHRVLSPDGVLNIQAESFNIPSCLGGIYEWRQRLLQAGFKRSNYGGITIPSYPTGHIGFLVSEKGETSTFRQSLVNQRFNAMVAAGNKTSYYHPPLQRSSFAIPLWAKEQIYGPDEPDMTCDYSDNEEQQMA